MVAKDLISSLITPMKTSSTGDAVLDMMANFYVRHLPIVNETNLLGTISEDDILDNDSSEPIGSYHLEFNKAYVREYDHVLDIIRKVSETRLSVIPVMNLEDNYIGMITMEDILHFLSSNFSFAHPGGILVLETDRKNYSLAEIARIIESEGAAVLSTFVSLNPDSTNVLVTVKVNREETQSIESSMERFSYKVVASFSKNELQGELMDRYDSLMKYLNV